MENLKFKMIAITNFKLLIQNLLSTVGKKDKYTFLIDIFN